MRPSDKPGSWNRFRSATRPVLMPSGSAKTRRLRKPRSRKATRPPGANLSAQQRAFHQFQRLYSEERPRQALGGKTPASLYRPSDREYPRTLPPIEYPGHFIVKRITNAG